MSNTLSIDIVKIEKLGSGEIWFGFNIYDQYGEAFCYEEPTDEAFKNAYPTTSSVLEKILSLNAFADLDMEMTNIHFDAPDWMIQNHIEDQSIPA